MLKVIFYENVHVKINVIKSRGKIRFDPSREKRIAEKHFHLVENKRFSRRRHNEASEK